MKDLKNSNSLLVEVAWEVCNQLGGIYTVIRSKVPCMTELWKNNYCLIGPYLHSKMPAEFEPCNDLSDPFGQAVKKMRDNGFEVHYGTWLVSGSPKVVLLNPYSVYYKLNDIKYHIWHEHNIATPAKDELLDQIIAFGFVTRTFLNELTNLENTDQKVIAHFHEWMVGTAIPGLRKDQAKISIVFTTHTTFLRRYLPMNDNTFYDNLIFYD